MFSWISSLGVIGLLMVGSPVGAQDLPLIVPSRPTVSNPAEFQRPGVLQVELGYNANFRAPSVSDSEDMPVAFRFAPSRRILLELDTDSPMSQKILGSRVVGAGDSQLGIQFVLSHESSSKPGVAAAYYAKLPSASRDKGLGSGRVDHSFMALVSKGIKRTTVDFNVAELVAGRTSTPGHASSGEFAVAASRGVSEHVGIQGEISGFSRSDEQPGASLGLGAVTYQVNSRLVLDCGLRFGLTANAPHPGVFAGLTIGVFDLSTKHRYR
jgi:hypothetical protein